MKKIIPFFILFIVFYACDSQRDLITPTHLTRVPKPYNLSLIKDTTKTGKVLINLTWLCEDNGNLRNFEVSRAYLKSENDTSLYYPVPPIITERSFADSTIPVVTLDSMEYFYRVNANGIDRFIGPVSDFVKIKIFKKK